MAPGEDLFSEWQARKKEKMFIWEDCTAQFLQLLEERGVETLIKPDEVDGACLMCSEPTPDQCHRRLAAEYLRDKWDRPLEIIHLA